MGARLPLPSSVRSAQLAPPSWIFPGVGGIKNYYNGSSFFLTFLTFALWWNKKNFVSSDHFHFPTLQVFIWVGSKTITVDHFFFPLSLSLSFTSALWWHKKNISCHLVTFTFLRHFHFPTLQFLALVWMETQFMITNHIYTSLSLSIPYNPKSELQ